jgi:hypothetical protein
LVGGNGGSGGFGGGSDGRLHTLGLFFGVFLNQFQLPLPGFPQFVGTALQSVSEASDGNRGQSRPHLSMKKDLSDFQQNGDKYVVWLAMLACAVLVGITYVYVDGDKYKNPNDKKKNAASK